LAETTVDSSNEDEHDGEVTLFMSGAWSAMVQRWF
jgi:hypothetical protein